MRRALVAARQESRVTRARPTRRAGEQKQQGIGRGGAARAGGRMTDPEPLAEDLRERAAAPAALARRVRRPADDPRAAPDLPRGGAPARARPWTTCCSMGRPGSARPRSPRIVAHELGRRDHAHLGPVIERPGDLAGLLTNLGPRGILFVDEIHRAEPGGRGVPLSGARGLHARHPARPRARAPARSSSTSSASRWSAPPRARDCCRRRCARASA